MPSIGGRGLRQQRWRSATLFALGLLALLILFVASRPRVSARPLANLEKNGVHGVYNLRARNGELLLFNFRAIESGKTYRSSNFPINHRGVLNGKLGLHPAAFFHGEAFEFVRRKNIRTIIYLDDRQQFDATKGYFEEWAKRKKYPIRLIHLPVPQGTAYSRNPRHQTGALARALQFIQHLETRSDNRSDKGAVLLMGEDGKDAVGVISAAYELWRNVGTAPADKLWSQVKERYLVSDVLISRDKEARKFAEKAACKEAKYKWVCPASLESLRPDLERIAQVG